MKAKSLSTGQLVAAKCMKEQFTNVDQVNNLRELQALKKLNPHCNIIDLLDVVYETNYGRLSLIFELMDMNLYEYIRTVDDYIDSKQLKVFMYQLLKAIDHMHKNGIFHRDIKPENILICKKNSKLKLADFGSCRGKYSKPPLTEYISTRWYRAPECLLTDGYYGSKMDIWGIGCVMFEIIALFPLFPGTNELDQIDRIHRILGTPNVKLLKSFQKHSTHIRINFKAINGTGIQCLIPHATPKQISLMDQLLTYDPSHRITSYQALQHRYFENIFEILQQTPDVFHAMENLNNPSNAVSESSDSRKIKTPTLTVVKKDGEITVAPLFERSKKRGSSHKNISQNASGANSASERSDKSNKSKTKIKKLNKHSKLQEKQKHGKDSSHLPNITEGVVDANANVNANANGKQQPSQHVSSHTLKPFQEDHDENYSDSFESVRNKNISKHKSPDKLPTKLKGGGAHHGHGGMSKMYHGGGHHHYSKYNAKHSKHANLHKNQLQTHPNYSKYNKQYLPHNNNNNNNNNKSSNNTHTTTHMPSINNNAYHNAKAILDKYKDEKHQSFSKYSTKAFDKSPYAPSWHKKTNRSGKIGGYGKYKHIKHNNSHINSTIKFNSNSKHTNSLPQIQRSMKPNNLNDYANLKSTKV